MYCSNYTDGHDGDTRCWKCTQFRNLKLAADEKIIKTHLGIYRNKKNKKYGDLAGGVGSRFGRVTVFEGVIEVFYTCKCNYINRSWFRTSFLS